jgi:hypothetical protein
MIRRRWALGLLALLLACGEETSSTSLLLVVQRETEVAVPAQLRARVFDGRGTVHDFATFPTAAPGTAAELGTLLIYPRPGRGPGALNLRVQLDGWVDARRVGAATAAVGLRAGRETQARIVLQPPSTPGLGDADADDVPDAIDNCPEQRNGDQDDADADGRGDACPGPGGDPAGDRADAALSPDAGDGPPPEAPDAPAGPFDGAPPPLAAPGAPCAAGGDCDSGACVDGVCCDSSCPGACQACNLPGALGRCTPLPAGTADPGSCAQQAPDSCGTDGTCDGNGSCRRHPAGTVCRPSTCAGDSALLMPGLCDGAGQCGYSTMIPCAPFACAAGQCRSSCAGAADCAPGNSCLDGSCGKKPLGAACAAGPECNSGNCLQGACCDVATCDGACRSCNVPGAAGSCRALARDAQPRGPGCEAQPAESCGRTGRCDGVGGCQLQAAGSTCAGPRCSGGGEVGGATCDGRGACQAGALRDCGRFVCRGTGCLTRCSDGGDCTAGNFCQADVCVPRRASGAACTAGGQCASGNCLDGRCCQQASCPGGSCLGEGGTCIERQGLGSDCRSALECESGACADGVCCDSACTDSCRRCDEDGRCRSIMNGTDPEAETPCVAPQRCAGGTCR